ncbi:uncharacterized protein N7482_007270 [Penicillium canariense]|uniref:Uncharacterized protein n=1 Tax=Penicillium canariense TaxID=189055 RepID=A0A9W9HZ50_9EURO|nr:uncharacterized protein N7482_007270 [Penicillium canariense]KAJ5160266.1 hypothetical protein N7482_007270 [Penicillium canariense]
MRASFTSRPTFISKVASIRPIPRLIATTSSWQQQTHGSEPDLARLGSIASTDAGPPDVIAVR